MNQSDTKQFASLITSVYAFYRQDVSPFAVGVWFEAMKPYDLAAVTDAINRHCVNPDNGQFMPKPADVVRMLSGTSIDSAMVAWSKFDKAIRTVGTYESVIFDDPLVHRVVADMGGWVQFGGKSEDEWPFVAKEFQTRYRGYSSRNEKPEYPPVLAGITEAQNRQNGFKSPQPRLIGDPGRAQIVYAKGTVSSETVNRLPDDTSQVLVRLVSSLEDAT